MFSYKDWEGWRRKGKISLWKNSHQFHQVTLYFNLWSLFFVFFGFFFSSLYFILLYFVNDLIRRSVPTLTFSFSHLSSNIASKTANQPITHSVANVHVFNPFFKYSSTFLLPYFSFQYKPITTCHKFHDCKTANLTISIILEQTLFLNYPASTIFFFISFSLLFHSPFHFPYNSAFSKDKKSVLISESNKTPQALSQE